MTDLPVNQVVAGDCLNVMRGFPDECVNLVMFSPPYWGLRDYGIEGQIGLEPTYQEYVAKMVEIGREVRRVLRGDGSWYLNLGDTYAGSWGNYGNRPELTGIEGTQRERTTEFYERKDAPDTKTWPVQRNADIPPKCKLLIPYRVALALVDDGWIVRNDITWYKPNAMPSSVKDRLTCQTERVFHFVKSNKTLFWTNEKTRQRVEKKPLGTKGIENADWQWVECPSCQLYEKGEVCEACEGTGKIKRALWQGHCYYYDLGAIREPHSAATIQRATQPTIFEQTGGIKQDMLNPITGAGGNYNRPAEMVKSIARDPSLGKNPGDVVKRDDVPGQTPQSIRKHSGYFGSNGKCSVDFDKGKNPGDFWPITTKPFPEAHFAVYPEALCERPIKSSCPPNGIVLDPMCGSGTTLVVAKRLGRRSIGIDLNPDYCGMARRRLGQVESPLEVFA